MRAILAQKTLWVAALGYFVDLYDLVLYGAVRMESLKGIGFTGDAAFQKGALLLNLQMAGMVAGGFLFGALGDRKGRKSALFSSILVYSSATFLNAFVNDLPTYGALRFMAGLGLAGELGVAVTFANELLPAGTRGMGSAWIASIGFLGAACSSLISTRLPWRMAYLLGGALGFLLLLARLRVEDPALFSRTRSSDSRLRFGALSLLASKSRLARLAPALLAGVPIWYVAGILSYFSPELASAMRIQGEVSAALTIFAGYAGAIVGDIACGLLSQRWRSRKKAVLCFLVLGGVLALSHPLFLRDSTPGWFYLVRGCIGFGNGYFATLIGWISESFGTNLRVTATSVLANLIRASVIPLTLGFELLGPGLGLLGASLVMGLGCYLGGAWGVLQMQEGFGRDLDFTEQTDTMG
jgi:putative MFS transporter